MNLSAVEKYNGVARTLHWLIGAGVIANIILALGHDAWKDLFPAMPIHKSIGITILALSLFRLFWRLGHRPPALPLAMPGWQKSLAHGLHWLFYFLIVALPITGWIMSSAGKYPLDWFGLFPIAKWPVEKGSLIAEISHEGHEVMGLLFIPLIALHIFAALYHHHAMKDDVLRRMF